MSSTDCSRTEPAVAGRLHRADVEDIFTLTPLQQGMLAASLGGRHRFRECSIITLDGQVNAIAFETAWRAVTARHPALRTAFLWDGAPAPRQVIFRRPRLRVRLADWTHLSAGDQERLLRRTLDRPAPDALDRAPLLALTLVHAAPRRYHLVWSVSHLIMDAYSFGIAIADWIASYRRALAGAAAASDPAPSMRAYVSWLKQQDVSSLRRAWASELRGHRSGRSRRDASSIAPSRPTPAAALASAAAAWRAAGRASGSASSAERRRVTSFIGADLATALRRRAITLRISISAPYLGALALARRVVTPEAPSSIAVVSSCRDLPVPGLDAMVGLIMNSVAAPVAIDEQRACDEWLAALDRDLRRLLSFAALPFHEQQDLAAAHGLRADVGFNFLTVNQGVRRAPGVVVAGVRQRLASSFPLGIDVMPGTAPGGETRIDVSYDPAAWDADAIARLLQYWTRFLTSLASAPADHLAGGPGASVRTPRVADLLTDAARDEVASTVAAAAARRARVLPAWLAPSADRASSRGGGRTTSSPAAVPQP